MTRLEDARRRFRCRDQFHDERILEEIIQIVRDEEHEKTATLVKAAQAISESVRLQDNKPDENMSCNAKDRDRTG